MIYKHRFFAPSKAAAPCWPITARCRPCRPWPPPAESLSPAALLHSPSLHHHLLSLSLPLYSCHGLYQTTSICLVCIPIPIFISSNALGPSLLASPNCPTVSLLIVSELFSSTFSHSRVLPLLALQAPRYYPSSSLSLFNSPLREILIFVTVFLFHLRFWCESSNLRFDQSLDI